MAAPYKVRCFLLGHEKDVRSVAPAFFPDGSFVSGSRDVTARLWAPNESNCQFTEAHVMSGHSNFISSVTVMPPSDQYPQGLIMTGSNDNSILAFTLESPQPVFKLTGHDDTVCALAAGRFGTLLSGSWDNTAKVWLNQKCVMTLKGHEQAVWAVAIMPEQGLMLTGSADKTVKMWRAARCENTFKGHSDCVRGLAVLSAAEFLSCSNDATVRRWLITGECVHTYSGHTNFVYSIAALPNGQDFVTTGEDRTLRIWKDGECAQTITHPATSVWAVCTLSNGDIVTGASDGVVRVFTKDPARTAAEETQKAFEEEVAASSIPSQVGDVKIEDLPGKEVLIEPGTREGQTKLVREGPRAMVYQWSMAESKWVKVGDVVGASGGSQETSGKTLYEGKEYDYVFVVDVEEGKPPLKLPYNVTEDPWFAAQNFIHKNNLSQAFLDQVAGFIIENTKSVTFSQQSAGSYSDPFTGGGRYVPGTAEGSTGVSSDPFTGGGRYVPGASQPQGPAPQSGSDPFTGAGSYRPSNGQTSSVAGGDMGNSLDNQYFPKTAFLSFDQANTQAIMSKLKEFNSSLSSEHAVEESSLAQLSVFLESGSPTAAQLELLWQLLHWPSGNVFPALDVLRLAIRSEEVNQHFCNQKDGPQFLNHLLVLGGGDEAPAANQMLVLRVICNAFKNKPGEKLMNLNREKIGKLLGICQKTSNKNVHIALSSVLLNFAISLHPTEDVEAKAMVLSTAADVAESVKDEESQFRLLVCLGTLVSQDPNSKALAKSLDLGQFAKKLTHKRGKVGDCASLVWNALQ
ncbi:phospholipase A-2-activating protein-like [Lingula anatina]|uniref:Phospholipase A-2-activating protein-like n=1 Tax=Lingula anatina TaxID=7574 RepID=A0A1S3I3K3_LINAN|nr:phospholipase A-2-activating protein-like [Lingula anatina]|eukprot:XP_013391939.1 phospholipase A-2-activating protein-like [Lingula anatina]